MKMMKENNDKIPKKEFESVAQILTVPELARALRVGRTTAYEIVRKGLIPSMRVGKVIRIPRQALENFLQKGGRE